MHKVKSAEGVFDLSGDVFENLALLLKLLESKNCKLRIAAIDKISADFLPGKFRNDFYPIKEVVDKFAGALLSDNSDEVVSALCGLTDIDSELARTFCLKYLSHKDSSVREEALTCLGYVGDKNDSKMLRSYLVFGENELLGVAAYLSLLRLEEAKCFDECGSIISLVSDIALCELVIGFCNIIDKYDFDRVLSQLSKRADKSGMEDLENEVGDLQALIERKKKQCEIINLNISDQNDIERLIEYFEHEDDHIRFPAISRFGAGQKAKKNLMSSESPSEFVFSKIKSMINDPSDEVRSEVLSVLGDWQRTEDIEFICKNLSDSSEQVRIDGLYALGDINDNKSITYLKKYNFEPLTTLEKVRYYQTCIRLGHNDYFEEWLSYLENSCAMVRENIAGGIWSVWKKERHMAIERALLQAMDKEQYLYVYNELVAGLKIARKNEGLGGN